MILSETKTVALAVEHLKSGLFNFSYDVDVFIDNVQKWMEKMELRNDGLTSTTSSAYASSMCELLW
jgi:hypothetical protein